MNKRIYKKAARSEYLAKNISLWAAKNDMLGKKDNEQKGKVKDNLYEMRRLASEVKKLVDSGISLDDAIDKVIEKNKDSMAFAKEKTANPRQSLLNWYNRNYQDRDDENER